MAIDPYYSVVETPDKHQPTNTSARVQRHRGRLYFVCQRGTRQLVMSVDARGREARRIIEEPSYVKDMRSLSLYNEDLFAVATGAGPG